MFKKNLIVVSSLALVVLLLVGCSSQKALWGNKKDGFTLTYRMSPDQSLRYVASGEQKTAFTMMGSDQVTVTTLKNDYTIVSTTQNDPNLQLAVTINDFVNNSESPQGVFNVDASPVIDKSFNVIVSPLGQELEFDGIDDLQLDFGSQNGGVQDVLNYYRFMFPDVPDHPVKIGESWVTVDEFVGPAGNMEVTVNAKNTHTLEGVEVVNGEELLKIALVSESVIAGKGEQDGAGVALAAEGQENGVWYFANKKGVFAKSESVMKMTGTVQISGGFEFSMPITQERTGVVQLVK